MPQVKPVVKIHAAACYFAFVSRDIQAIATQFDASDRTVRRWREEPEWDEALDICKYTGSRKFQVQPSRNNQRDHGNVFSKVRAVYIQAMKDGVANHRLATVTEAETGIDRRTIRRWAKQHGWREEAEKSA